MLSAPIHINTLNDESMKGYLADFKKGGFGRVFICGLPELNASEEKCRAAAEKCRKYGKMLQAAGIEFGIWISAFGHGGVLAHEAGGESLDFPRLMGPAGKTTGDSFCPASPDYRAAYCRMVEGYASALPDIFMLDDDFRLSHRRYGAGCFCPLHLAEFERRAKKKVKNGEEMFRLAFLTPELSDRQVWLSTLADSLYDFAAAVRAAVDRVDPRIRCGVAMCMDPWDASGTDAAHLARIFAGKTQPFLRTIGAPYWDALSSDGTLPLVVEYTRMQFAHQKKEQYRDIEFMAEGDVYPRYRTQVPAALAELYHLALIAAGQDALLKYVFDYAATYGYETGYVDAHMHYEKMRQDFRQLFAEKSSTGIRVWEEEHRVATYDFLRSEDPAGELTKIFFTRAPRLFALASIPTVYEESEYPVCVLGESARHIPQELLCRGAILDVRAAELLRERGVDVGLLCQERIQAAEEHYGEGEWVVGVGHSALYGLTPKPEAKVLSYLEPSHTPSAYLYENDNGLRFLVLGYDAYALRPDEGERFLLNYYRSRQIEEAVSWLCGKRLPALCRKCPSLYLSAARGKDGSLSVALLNMHADPVFAPEVFLGDTYKSLRLVGAEGTLLGDRVRLSAPIPAYSALAFEVK